MKNIKLLVFIILFVPCSNLLGQTCNCEKELNWVIGTIQENDASYQYIVDKKEKNDYDRFTYRPHRYRLD